MSSAFLRAMLGTVNCACLQESEKRRNPCLLTKMSNLTMSRHAEEREKTGPQWPTL